MTSDREKVLQFEKFSLELINNRTSKVVLKDVSLELCQAETLALVGESGAGKTMLLRSIQGLFEDIEEYKSDGAVKINIKGEWMDVHDLDLDELQKLRSNHIAWILQASAQVLNPSFRIQQEFENSISISNNTATTEDFISILKDVGFSDPQAILKKYPHELSGGQIQRIIIASALLRNTDIFLVDEPTSGLDADLKSEILDLLFGLQKERSFSMILVSHNLKLVKDYCDTIAVLKDGVLLEKAKVADLINSPQHAYTISLLSEKEYQRTEAENSDLILMEIVELEFSYPASKWSLFRRSAPLILEGINLELYDNEILGIVGASGSGKSSLARILAGLLEPSKGKVMYKGVELTDMSLKEFRAFRKEVQIIFQDALSSLAPHYTAQRILSEIASINEKKLYRDELVQYLASFELTEDILDRKVTEMSGGQRQRLLIARSLIAEPKILICDEIVSSLDSIIKHQIIELLLKLKEERGFSLVFVSHDMELVQAISNRIIRIPA